MPQDSSKVLKELSMLSTNMDILVKELREQNKKTSENTEQIKKLVEEGDKKQAKEATGKTEPSNEGFFKKLTESFAKEVSNNNKSLTENLTKQIAGDFGGITKNLIKPAEAKAETGDKSGGQLMDAFVKSLLSGIPRLETGGSINKSGVALVGEKGPELVNLNKGNSVSSNDKMAELLQFELDDRKRKEAEKKTNSEGKIVTGSTNLSDSITNSFGVKVPKSEIDAYREEIKRDYADFIKEDPSFLEEEVKAFIDDYRETMDLEKFKNFNETQKATLKEKQSAPIVENPVEEISKREKRKKEREAKNFEKEKAESLVSPGKPNLLESIKAKGKDFISEQKSSIEEKLAGAGLITKKEKTGEAEKSTPPSKLETEKFDLSTTNASSIKDLTAKLKAEMEAKKKAEPTKTVSEASSESEDSTSKNQVSSTPAVTKETKQEESSNAMTQKDLQDIKALLAGIYKSLSGPLNIANDRPFRPNSNVL